MANESLGKIVCRGCDNDADIKRRTNGKRLLYLHCKNCGLDQRSGAKLQTKWQNAIDGCISSPIEQQQQNKEWQPESENLANDNTEQQRTKPDENSNSRGNWFTWGAIGAIIAFITKSARV